MMRKGFPFKPEVQERKTGFEVLNESVRSRNGWITSAHGDVDVTIECLPGSSLPDERRARGYDLVATGDGERILPTAITERFCIGADGELEPVTSGSTQPVVQIVTHAGEGMPWVVGQFDCGKVPGWKTGGSGRIFARWQS